MEQKQLISKEDVIFNFHQIVRSRKNFRIEEIIIIIAKKKESWFLNIIPSVLTNICQGTISGKEVKGGEKHISLYSTCYMKICLTCPPF